MKRKAKRKRKNKNNPFDEPFPTELILNFKEISSGNVIVTDAGFDTASYQQAFQSFGWMEIINWWESSLDSEQWESLESELPQNIWRLSLQESCSLIDSLLSKFDWLPSLINVITAKAVKDDNYQWVKLIDINHPYSSYDNNFAQFEVQAINLGIRMSLELGQENLLIVNDNQEAVANRHRSEDEKYFNYDLESEYYNGYIDSDFLDKYDEAQIARARAQIYWMPRQYVRLADQLKIQQATQLFF